MERMDTRAAIVREKRERRLRDKERRLEQREADFVKSQRSGVEKLMNNPIPTAGRRLTKAVEERTRLNRERVERHRLQEKRAKEQKDEFERATAADKKALRRLVAEQEDLRKARAGVSLESPEERGNDGSGQGSI